MALESLFVLLIIGLCAGWLAGQIFKGHDFGLVGNLVVGVIGAFLGGYIFSALNISYGGFLGSLVCATVGAIVLLFGLQVARQNGVRI